MSWMAHGLALWPAGGIENSTGIGRGQGLSCYGSASSSRDGVRCGGHSMSWMAHGLALLPAGGRAAEKMHMAQAQALGEDKA